MASSIHYLLSTAVATVLSQAPTITILEANVVIFPGSGQQAGTKFCQLLDRKVITRDQAGDYLSELQKALIATNNKTVIKKFTNSFNETTNNFAKCNLVLTDQSTTSPY